ncbi:MAG: hypothetical protein ACLPWF_08650 [Bryobacteraceae bacterium]
MGDRLIKSNWSEAIIGILIPPACREEVLGDLHERNASPARYLMDAVRTVPLVILSRIRRTANPELLAMYAIALYLCFFAVAWYDVRPLLYERWGLWRLAIPCAVGLLALVLEDAYANSGRTSGLWWLRGPMFAVAAAFVSQAALWAAGSSLVLPFVIVFRGGAVGFVLTFTVRLLFQPPSKSRRGPI